MTMPPFARTDPSLSARAPALRPRWQARMLCCLLVWATAYASSYAAAETASIELTDGSTLKGEVLSLKGGAYEIKTSSLGIVRVPQADIALVSYGNGKGSGTTAAPAKPPHEASPAAAQSSAAAISSLQSSLSQNPETLALIMGLGQDPVVQSVINDPEIQAVIASGNIAALMEHPKILRLMRHPTVRKITNDASPAR